MWESPNYIWKIEDYGEMLSDMAVSSDKNLTASAQTLPCFWQKRRIETEKESIALMLYMTLKVDLLINTWQLERLGQLLSSYVLPCVGADAFNAKASEISTELQV